MSIHRVGKTSGESGKTLLLHIFQPEYGGVVAYVEALFPYFQESNFNQIILCPPAVQKSDIFHRMGADVRYFDIKRKINPFDDIKNIIYLRSVIKQINPDCIYLHSSKAGALGRIAAMGLGYIVCYNPHGWAFIMDGGTWKKRIYGIIEKLLSRFCTTVIVVSKSELNSARARGIPADKIHLIESGIDVGRFMNNSKKTDFQDRFVVGFSGRLSTAKNPSKVLEIIHQLIPDIPEILGLFVGDGELRGKLLVQAQELGILDYVQFAGWVSHPEDLISNFDVGLMPSRWEAFGLAVCEYMAAGIPVVVSSAGGLQDIVTHKEDGFIAVSGETDEYCQYILQIYQNKDLGKSLTSAAFSKVSKRFAVSRMANEHLELFYTLLESDKHG